MIQELLFVRFIFIPLKLIDRTPKTKYTLRKDRKLIFYFVFFAVGIVLSTLQNLIFHCLAHKYYIMIFQP